MENSTEKQKKPWYKRTWVIIVGIILLLIIIGNIGGKGGTQSTERKPSTKETSTPETINKETSVPKTNWSYNEDEDKMTNEKRYFANCTSTNEVEFKFPYDGGASLYLIVRQMGKGNEIVMKISNGQFMTSIGSSESLRVKFDNEQPLTFSYNSAADGSTDIIFLNNSAKFLAKLKSAKKLLVEATFFNEGQEHFEFDIEGLKWDK